MKSPRETALVKNCIEYLGLRGWLAWRNNTGALKSGNRLIRFGAVGSGDVFALGDGVFLSIECKLPGKHPTEAQKDWIDRVNRQGGVAAVIRSLDELVALVESLEA